MQTALRAGEVRAVMNGLWTAALARPLDATQGVWELSHDFVARAVARYLGWRRVDWPGIARAYAAPALLVLMAATVAGALIGNVNGTERLRAQLADFGVDVSQDEREAAISPRFKVENWSKIGLPPGALTPLQSLDLTRAPITDLAPLGPRRAPVAQLNRNTRRGPHASQGLTALQFLDLKDTQVADLAPLRGLTALHDLSLWGTQVTDLTPLKGLRKLRALLLTGTSVTDLAPLKELTTLQFIELSSVDTSDLTALQDLPNLYALGGIPDTARQTLNTYRSQKGLPPIIR